MCGSAGVRQVCVRSNLVAVHAQKRREQEADQAGLGVWSLLQLNSAILENQDEAQQSQALSQ
eukprot:m.490898 g.490898  ORF g.490898 m.490898 type:complete len:62 (-) comp28797_c0_seq1:184-369(-)